MPNLNLLFEGATRAPVREFLGVLWRDGKYSRGVMPAVGRYTAVAGVVAGGAKPSQMYCSDISLFSSLLGYHLDPVKDIDELGIRIDGPAKKFVERPKDPADWTAGVLLAQKWLQTHPTNPYVASHRTEWWTNRKDYRAHIREQVLRLEEGLGGIHYEISDARPVLKASARLKGAFMFIAPPFYKGGYSAMFHDSEAALSWKGIDFEPLEPAGIGPMLAPLLESPMTSVVYIRGEVADQFSDWHRLLALESKLYGWTGTVTEYVVSNKALDKRRVILREGAGSAPRRFPIFDDAEIRPDSEIRVVAVDKNTALWYRDLFVHRLGSTAAREYYMFLIDGRAVAVCGVSLSEILRGQHNWVYEVFGIAATSKRYARLGKLYMLLLTSGDMKRYLETSIPSLTLRDLKGVQTSTFSEHAESQRYRGVMKLWEREQLPDGGYRLTHRAEFRKDTWREATASWLKQWGSIERS